MADKGKKRLNKEAQKMLRIQFEVGDELVTEMLTPEQVVEALVTRFSSMDKPNEEIVVDLFRAIDKGTANELTEDLMRMAAVELQKKKINYSLTDLVERLISPAENLRIRCKDVVVDFIKSKTEQTKSTESK